MNLGLAGLRTGSLSAKICQRAGPQAGTPADGHFDLGMGVTGGSGHSGLKLGWKVFESGRVWSFPSGRLLAPAGDADSVLLDQAPALGGGEGEVAVRSAAATAESRTCSKLVLPRSMTLGWGRVSRSPPCNAGERGIGNPPRSCYLKRVMPDAGDHSPADDAAPHAARGGAFGAYFLQELINSGGMADIWLASDARGRPCAVRRLHEHLRFNWTARQRFFSGCEILAKIHDHELIIGYTQHGSIRLTPYLVMEYVESNNLKELYARQDSLLVENAAQILIDLALALAHVHENGFMHLDFKPENVLVTRNGKLRLVDFDLAQPIPEHPLKVKRNPGTPAYMAPEQLQRTQIDQRVDIFAYGVAAYELLTNQKPFPGDEPGEILARQLDRSNFAPPRALNPDLPPALEKIILKCLENEPGRRYPFVSVLAREVQAALYV